MLVIAGMPDPVTSSRVCLQARDPVALWNTVGPGAFGGVLPSPTVVSGRTLSPEQGISGAGQPGVRKIEVNAIRFVVDRGHGSFFQRTVAARVIHLNSRPHDLTRSSSREIDHEICAVRCDRPSWVRCSECERTELCKVSWLLAMRGDDTAVLGCTERMLRVVAQSVPIR